jgi:hypothetical protein
MKNMTITTEHLPHSTLNCPSPERISRWVKWAFTIFTGGLMPVYWHQYGWIGTSMDGQFFSFVICPSF